MADGQHNGRDGGVPAVGPETARRASLEVTRRTLLGAPLVPLILSGAERSRSALSKDAAPIWERALARFHEAQAILDTAVHEPDQVRYDALLDSHGEALCALLRSPAPDLPALAAKLDAIVAQQAWENSGSEDCLEILRQDAHRLAASAA